MARFAITVAAVLFAAGTAEAAARFEMGSGNASCGAWTHDRQTLRTDDLLVVQWVFGFISSANTMRRYFI
jgi:hypothetical protein